MDIILFLVLYNEMSYMYKILLTNGYLERYFELSRLRYRIMYISIWAYIYRVIKVIIKRALFQAPVFHRCSKRDQKWYPSL